MDHTKLAGAFVPVGALTDNDKVDTGLPSHGSVREAVLTKNPLQRETILELRRRVPNGIGVKESNQDCVNMQRLLALTRDERGLPVLTGSEFLILAGLQMGVHGCVEGLHNLCPHIVAGLYEASRLGDLETARERQTELIELWRIFNCGRIWGVFDEALHWLGIFRRAMGAPYITTLSEEEHAKVHAIVARYLSGSRPRSTEVSSC